MTGSLFAATSVTSVMQSTGLAAQFRTIVPSDLFMALGFGFVTGLIIAFVYRKTYRGVLYSPSFALTLVMLTLITTPVVMCIKSDIALSMGMVGALSIVRFRTAVKDPLDTAYMFWALTAGILLGAGLHLVAMIVVLCISVLMFIMTFIKFGKKNGYLLVVHCDDALENALVTEISKRTRSYRLRSKSISRNGTELTYEVRLDDNSELVNRILDLKGVYDATLVACQSEVGA